MNPSFWNGDINWLTSGELNRGIVTRTIEKITDKGLRDANLKLVPKGTFVIAITGLEASGTRGNCAILGIDSTLNQSCMAIIPDSNKTISSFLFQWYSVVSEKYGQSFTQGTKQQSYTAEILKKLPISLPNNIIEQIRLANLLNHIDSLIALHQREVLLLILY